MLNAIAHVESRGNPAAVSQRGALGRYQLMPVTAAWCGADPLDPQRARRCAARLLRLHLRRSGGDVRWALAAYVAGAGRVARGERVPKSVQRYVDAVLQRAEVVR